MIGRFIGGFITILVGVTLLDEVSKELYSGTNLIGWTVDGESYHRQTYKEYVEERLAIEREMR